MTVELTRRRRDFLLTGVVVLMTSYWLVDIVFDASFPRFGLFRLGFDFFFLLAQIAVVCIVCISLKRRRELEAVLTAERETAEHERARFETILSAISEGISVQDRNYRVIYQNEAHRQLVGRDACGEICHEAYSLESTICEGCPVALTFADGQPHVMEKRLVRSSEERYIEILASPLCDRDGRLVAAIELVRDVTHRWAANREIRQLNESLRRKTDELLAANKELEAFNYSLSHDLRTPLSQIETASELLQENFVSGSFGSETDALLVRTIRQGGERIEQMLHGMLELSRLSRSEINRQHVAISLMAAEVIDTLRCREPLRQVEVTIEPDLYADVDPGLLRIVLQNLLENAWKYTGHTETAKIVFGHFAENGRDFFYVQDNGAGFNPTQVGRIFMPFQRLHSQNDFQGDGIGLSTVYRIVQLHGGTIRAEGQVGVGATFTFTLTPETL